MNYSEKCLELHKKDIKPFTTYDVSKYEQLYINSLSFPIQSKELKNTYSSDSQRKLKPFVNLEEMYLKLEKEGIKFTDEDIESSKIILNYINYHRLSVYRLFLSEDNKTFSRILQLYYFDEKLKNLISSLIPTIENYIKRSFAYGITKKYEENKQLSNKKCQFTHASLCYTDMNIYKKEVSENDIKEMLSIFAEIITSKIGKDPMIDHHIDKYNGNIPIWVLVEFLTLGNIHRLSTSIDRSYRKEWNKALFKKSKDSILPEWINTIKNLRNMCAHNARLYGSRPIYNPAIIDEELEFLKMNKRQDVDENDFLNKSKHTIFAGIIVLKYFYKELPEYEKNRWKKFIDDLSLLFYEYDIDLYRIGFPINWKDILTID
ncbi:Abi family protein [Macrococcoides canis]|uniref:Abi family protein n=1 Tax=Macrococcoides canis TaxID=1855823 RepID=UPI001F3FE46E|nr:Abi family protein [Macrococcus canis]UJS28886.1 Abi family protein [Macrococcus canis]